MSTGTTTTPTAAAADLAINGGTPVTDSPIHIVVVSLGEEEINAVAKVMRSGMLAQGAVTAQFEEQFAELTDAKHAIACGNGTLALQLAYQCLLDRDASAITPAWTFIATASMVRARPAVPIFADVELDSFNIDINDAKSRVAGDTQVIAPVHLYGNPVDIDAVQALAKSHNLKVVYDAAQSHLARYNNRGLGAFGDCVTYSFYPTKNMTTGEGGMVTTNDDALADELRITRDHGAKVRYQHDQLGFNWRMTDIQAAIGIEQLKKLPHATQKRQHNAARLTELLADVDGIITPTVADNAEHVYHQYTCRLELDKFTCDRATFLAALKAEGCSWALHYPSPLHRQPVFVNDPLIDTTARPRCEQLAETIFCLPVHQHLTEQQITQIADCVTKVAGAFRG